MDHDHEVEDAATMSSLVSNNDATAAAAAAVGTTRKPKSDVASASSTQRTETSESENQTSDETDETSATSYMLALPDRIDAPEIQHHSLSDIQSSAASETTPQTTTPSTSHTASHSDGISSLCHAAGQVIDAKNTLQPPTVHVEPDASRSDNFYKAMHGRDQTQALPVVHTEPIDANVNPDPVPAEPMHVVSGGTDPSSRTLSDQFYKTMHGRRDTVPSVRSDPPRSNHTEPPRPMLSEAEGVVPNRAEAMPNTTDPSNPPLVEQEALVSNAATRSSTASSSDRLVREQPRARPVFASVCIVDDDTPLPSHQSESLADESNVPVDSSHIKPAPKRPRVPRTVLGMLLGVCAVVIVGTVCGTGHCTRATKFHDARPVSIRGEAGAAMVTDFVNDITLAQRTIAMVETSDTKPQRNEERALQSCTGRLLR